MDDRCAQGNKHGSYVFVDSNQVTGGRNTPGKHPLAPAAATFSRTLPSQARSVSPSVFSPETSPQLVDSSSWRSHQTSTVAPAALRGREISAVSALTRFDSPAASPPLPPRLRGSASKSPSRRTRPASQVSHPLPPRRRRGISSALSPVLCVSAWNRVEPPANQHPCPLGLPRNLCHSEA